MALVCNRGANPQKKKTYLEKSSLPHFLSSLHLISQVSCETRRLGRLHIAHFILTTGSWDEALRETDEGTCLRLYSECVPGLIWSMLRQSESPVACSAPSRAVRYASGLWQPGGSREEGLAKMKSQRRCGAGSGIIGWECEVDLENDSIGFVLMHRFCRLRGSTNVFNPNLFVRDTRQTPKTVICKWRMNVVLTLMMPLLFNV